MKRFISMIGIALAALVLTFSCAKKEEIKIGAIVPLTGENAVYGSALKKGMDLALGEINDKGGIGRKRLKIIYEDSQVDPKVAVSAVNKLITVDKVSIILGGMFSSTTLAIAPITEKSKVVLLSPTASAEAVPNTGPHTFSIYPSDAYDGIFLANFVYNELNKKTAAIIYVQADAMIVCTRGFKNTFKKQGGKIVIEENYPPGTNDFRSILSKVKSLNPEVVCIPGYLDEIVKILRQAKELGVRSQFVTISTAFDSKIFELSKDAAEGLLMSAPFYEPETDVPEVVKFRNSFEKKYNEIPNVWAAYGYDVINIASLAYTNSEQKGTELKDELLRIEDFPGVTGKASFLENGGVEKVLRIMSIKKGKFIEYK